MEVSLRKWTMADAPVLAKLANNINVWNNVRDRMPHPYTESNAREWIASVMYQEPAFHFAIMYGGEVTGNIGLLPKEDVSRLSVEIGYFIGEPYWGKGIATAAVKLLIPHAWQHFDFVRIYAEVFDYNIASMKPLEKNGFYLESIRKKSVVKNGIIRDDYVWVLLRED
jgi:[ribosomal protein S5]-alanine N-acetyltransferase